MTFQKNATPEPLAQGATIEWKPEGVLAPVPLGSAVTRFGKLACYQDGKSLGSINVQGCGLMGLTSSQCIC